MNTLKKALTNSQLHAYSGAKTFYRCLVPFAMLVLVVSHLFLLGVRQTQVNYFPLAATVLSIFIYFPALKYYQLCNQIDTTPVLQSFDVLQICNKQQSSELEESNLVLDKPQRWRCQKCDILCDYRTRHCRKCQVCIQRYDHHCFWIGNCVGRHNHRPFFIFLFLQTSNNLLNFYSLYQLHPLFQQSSISIPQLLYVCYLTTLLMAFGFIIFTGYLFLYHSMLVSYGLTTWEHMRRSKISYLNYLPTGYNPFSKGVVQNIRTFFSETTRQSGVASGVSLGQFLPTFAQSKQISAGCNLIENEYYSCC